MRHLVTFTIIFLLLCASVNAQMPETINVNSTDDIVFVNFKSSGNEPTTYTLIVSENGRKHISESIPGSPDEILMLNVRVGVNKHVSVDIQYETSTRRAAINVGHLVTTDDLSEYVQNYPEIVVDILRYHPDSLRIRNSLILKRLRKSQEESRAKNEEIEQLIQAVQKDLDRVQKGLYDRETYSPRHD